MATSTDPSRGATPAAGLATIDEPVAATAHDGSLLIGSGQPGTGRYVLGEEIAQRGMGVIDKANDRAFGREVEVKVVRDQSALDLMAGRRFADEVRITGRFRHPGIPPVHDTGTLPDEQPFLAMKLVTGETLDDLLCRRPAGGGSSPSSSRSARRPPTPTRKAWFTGLEAGKRHGRGLR